MQLIHTSNSHGLVPASAMLSALFCAKLRYTALTSKHQLLLTVFYHETLTNSYASLNTDTKGTGPIVCITKVSMLQRWKPIVLTVIEGGNVIHVSVRKGSTV